MELPKGQKRKVKERLKAYVKDPYALDLIDKLLVLDPAQRVDSDDALNHDFFWSDPMPSDLKHMLSTHNTSMFEYLAPPRRRGHMPQPPANLNRNPATASQPEFDRVFWFLWCQSLYFSFIIKQGEQDLWDQTEMSKVNNSTIRCQVS